jgi:hypothetical protein
MFYFSDLEVSGLEVPSFIIPYNSLQFNPLLFALMCLMWFYLTAEGAKVSQRAHGKSFSISVISVQLSMFYFSDLEVSGLEVPPFTILYNSLQFNPLLFALMCLMWFKKKVTQRITKVMHKVS